MPRETGSFEFLSPPLRDPCLKCSSIMDTILKEEEVKIMCNLGDLTFHPDCGPVDFSAGWLKP
jgi:hypothetical protein